MDDEPQAACIVKRVQDAYAGSDGSLSALIAILTEGDELRMRQGPAAGAASAAAASVPDAGRDSSTDASVTSTADAGVMPKTDDSPLPGLTLSRVVDNDWGAGYCYTYEVKNTSSAPMVWSVPLDVEGTLNQHWQSEISASSGHIVFTGASYNATLEPAASTQFGFCAMR